MKLAKTSEKVHHLLQHVGDFIRQEAREFDRSRIEHKGFNNLVSYVDKEAELRLVEGLKYICPEAGFITEEETLNEQQPEWNWIVDPLDGTTNFLHSLPVYSVSVALKRGDELVLGAVYELNRDEYFHAYKEGGAYLNGKSIHISEPVSLSDSLIATGFPYENFDKLDDYLQVLKGFMQRSHGVRRLGSAAVDLAYVACGRFEGFFEFNLNSWDVAGGAVLVKEAGGTVTDFRGGDNFLFGGEIVASGHIHPEMLKTIQEFWR
jgi:myo-inositol-1(or 4)-monophosphatase